MFDIAGILKTTLHKGEKVYCWSERIGTHWSDPDVLKRIVARVIKNCL